MKTKDVVEFIEKPDIADAPDIINPDDNLREPIEYIQPEKPRIKFELLTSLRCWDFWANDPKCYGHLKMIVFDDEQIKFRCNKCGDYQGSGDMSTIKKYKRLKGQKR